MLMETFLEIMTVALCAVCVWFTLMLFGKGTDEYDDR